MFGRVWGKVAGMDGQKPGKGPALCAPSSCQPPPLLFFSHCATTTPGRPQLPMYIRGDGVAGRGCVHLMLTAVDALFSLRVY